MSQQVQVERDLVFSGVAEYTQNVEGNMNPVRVCYDEHFFADMSENDWVEEETNGGTIAWAAPHTVTLTLGGTDNDVAEFSHAATTTCNKNFFFLARCHLDAITAVGANIGLVDADMSTDNQICFEITGVALVNGRVSNGAAFVFDTDGTTDVWYCCATKGDAEGTPATFTGKTYGATTAPVASTYAYFGIKGDTSGNVTFYYNGEPVGYQPAALTASTALIPYVANIAREGAAKVLTVDRIALWQDED